MPNDTMLPPEPPTSPKRKTVKKAKLARKTNKAAPRPKSVDMGKDGDYKVGGTWIRVRDGIPGPMPPGATPQPRGTARAPGILKKPGQMPPGQLKKRAPLPPPTQPKKLAGVAPPSNPGLREPPAMPIRAASPVKAPAPSPIFPRYTPPPPSGGPGGVGIPDLMTKRVRRK